MKVMTGYEGFRLTQLVALHEELEDMNETSWVWLPYGELERPHQLMSRNEPRVGDPLPVSVKEVIKRRVKEQGSILVDTWTHRMLDDVWRVGA